MKAQFAAMEKKVIGIGGNVVTLGGSGAQNKGSGNDNNNNNKIVKKSNVSNTFFRVGQGGSVTYYDANRKQRLDWKKKVKRKV